MIIDCDTCLARDLACDDCVVNVMFHDGLVDLDDEEWQALNNLSEAGLISRVQFLRPGPPGETNEGSRLPA